MGIINWENLMRVMMPPPPQPREGERQENGWDKQADFYNRMASMELEGTLNQLNCLPLTPDMTVLDAGCGPGRITCQVAKRVKKVTSLDSSVKMMENCRANIAKNGLTNVDTVLVDWNEVKLGETIEPHDVIICSRSVGCKDIDDYSKFARKYAVVLCWANAPNLPDCASQLTKGVFPEQKMPGPGGPPMMMRNRDMQYNIQYNMIYDAGYEPNVNIVKDGFGKHYETMEEAYEDLSWFLQRHPNTIVPGVPQEGELHPDMDRFRANVDKFTKPNPDGGFDFFIETRTYVIWWETKKRNLYFD